MKLKMQILDRVTHYRATSAHAYSPWVLSSTSSQENLKFTSATMSMICSMISIGIAGLDASITVDVVGIVSGCIKVVSIS